MKKIALTGCALLLTLTACNQKVTYTYWTDKTDNQLERLEEADIDFEIRGDEIWVDEEEMDQVVACCS
ncbi:hypothetical protein LQ226_10840 [Pontibacillus sp. HN14]|nr:hypothetical protein [Pontibacillus sp. HN14]